MLGGDPRPSDKICPGWSSTLWEETPFPVGWFPQNFPSLPHFLLSLALPVGLFPALCFPPRGSAGEDVLPVSAAQRVLYCVRTPRHSSGCYSLRLQCSCTAGSQERIKVFATRWAAPYPASTPFSQRYLLSEITVPLGNLPCLLWRHLKQCSGPHVAPADQVQWLRMEPAS